MVPFFCVLFALLGGGLAAGERCDIHYVNNLGEEILAIRVKYSTPYAEPRFAASRVNLSPGRDYRIGVQGVILPEEIIIDLATKSLVFEDLSRLRPAASMALSLAHRDGVPVIDRLDAPGGAQGVERQYLSTANRPNAVDKDFIMDAASAGAVYELVREQVEESLELLGELERVDIEAGPLRNQAHAEARCPEVAEEYGRGARWTRQWRTTVPGRMSVCGCLAGTADFGETLFREDSGWGETIYFPVHWEDRYGVGSAAVKTPPEVGMMLDMRFRLPDEARGVGEMLEDMLSDLRVDGFRPVWFSLETGEENAGGEWERDEIVIDFNAETLDKWDAHDRIMEELAAGYGKPALTGSLIWIEDEAFEQGRESGEIPPTRGVLCMFSKGVFEALFVANGRMLMR